MKLSAEIFAIAKFITQHPLNTTHKLKAIANFFRWQIGTRILKRKVIVPWVENSMFITGYGEAGLTGNIYAGFMEYEDMLFLLHAIQPDETFVDVGANIGAYTILASKVIQCKSIAFEPLPETADRLMDQIKINRIESIVDVRNMGIGDKQGALFFTNKNDTINKVSLVDDAKNTTRIEVGTLDSELSIDCKYFFKIDVEGFEYHVIEGASKILSTENVSAIIIELNGSGEDFGYSNEVIHNKIVDFKFFPVSYDPQTRTIKKLSSYNKNAHNTIYVRDIDCISERCKLAPLRIVHTAFGITI
ncbi:MAG: FkbM family methyltransferase [Glaciimonas sp.]|nr:FkbM family methyltransferase [Glaciimonas sp.]